ncbi:MAG: hypothetical protein WC002_04700 [Candidatus Muiribacteriota bacterium]
MKKETDALIKSVQKFEERLKKEAEKVSEIIAHVDQALECFKEAGKAHKELQKKLSELEKKTDKLVQYKGFDITKNYEEHNQYKAMKFIDEMRTTLTIFKGIKKKSEETPLRIVSKKYIDEILKKYKNFLSLDGSDLILRNNADETVSATLGNASELDYYISGITYNTKPGARIQFNTIYKFADFFSDSDNSSASVVNIFIGRK